MAYSEFKDSQTLWEGFKKLGDNFKYYALVPGTFGDNRLVNLYPADENKPTVTMSAAEAFRLYKTSSPIEEALVDMDYLNKTSWQTTLQHQKQWSDLTTPEKLQLAGLAGIYVNGRRKPIYIPTKDLLEYVDDTNNEATVYAYRRKDKIAVGYFLWENVHCLWID